MPPMARTRRRRAAALQRRATFSPGHPSTAAAAIAIRYAAPTMTRTNPRDAGRPRALADHRDDGDMSTDPMGDDARALTSCRWRRPSGPGMGRLVMPLIALCIAMSGCAYSSQLAPTQPSAVTQQLVIRSLERALAQLDLTGLVGRRISLAIFTQTANQLTMGPPQAGNQAFVKEYVTTWFQSRGVWVTSESADLTLKVAASVLGTDRGETFIGIPAFQVPILAIPFPEISLFKWIRNRGL